MNKNDLIWYLRKQHNLTLKDARKIINGLFNHMQQELIKGNTIQITKFGTLHTINNKHKTINLQGQNYPTKALKTVNFKPSRNFNKKFRKETTDGKSN